MVLLCILTMVGQLPRRPGEETQTRLSSPDVPSKTSVWIPNSR